MPEEVEPPVVFAMPDKSRLSLIDFPFYLPMELLGIPNCLKVILAILLEQKVHFLTKRLLEPSNTLYATCFTSLNIGVIEVTGLQCSYNVCSSVD